MKYGIVFAALVFIGLNAGAKDSTSKSSKRGVAVALKEQGCFKMARRALLQNSLQLFDNTDTDADFEYINGAMVGDGVMSVEIDVYKNKNSNFYFKVESNAAMCTLRSIEQLQ